MRDQAVQLRLAAQIPPLQKLDLGPGGPRVIAVASGKGGVGKTSLAVNLGLVLGRMGRRVLLLDADLGLANAEILLGLAPRYSLRDVLYGDKHIREVVTPGPHNLWVVSGGSGFYELANLDSAQQSRVLEMLRYFRDDTDYILIDTGAGINKNVIAFAAAAGEVLLVITPEPTSLTDAYSLLKVLARFGVPAEVGAVVNRAADEFEGQAVAARLTGAADRFLRFPVRHLGTVCEDRAVGLAVKRQAPLVLAYPGSPAARNIVAVAHRLAEGGAPPGKNGNFVTRLLRAFGLG
ncbi:MAG: MinD/ParA family protein [Bacillota bacterium]